MAVALALGLALHGMAEAKTIRFAGYDWEKAAQRVESDEVIGSFLLLVRTLESRVAILRPTSLERHKNGEEDDAEARIAQRVDPPARPARGEVGGRGRYLGLYANEVLYR